MSYPIRDRIINLLRDSDLNEKTEILVYNNLIKKMLDSDLMNQIDVAHIRLILQKENKLDAEKIAAVFKINK